MFLAVQKYRTGLWEYPDKVAVLDTDDGSVETIPVEDIIGTGIYVHNFFSTTKLVRGETLPEMFRILDIKNSIIRFVKYELLYKNWVLSISATNRIVDCNGVNTFGEYSCYITELMYLFEFSGILVLRFYIRGMSKWYTLGVAPDGSVSYWDANVQYGDKKLISRIDLLSEV